MSWDLHPEEMLDKLSGFSLTQTPEVGIWHNFMEGAAKVAMKGLAETARAGQMVGSVVPIYQDWMTDKRLEQATGKPPINKTITAQEKYFKAMYDGPLQSAVDYWTPRPNEVGVAGEVAGSLLSMLPTIMASPALAVGATQLTQAQNLVREGTPADKANAVGAVQALGLGAGIWMPILGTNAVQRILIGGAGFNVAQGVATRAASKAILEGEKAAEQFRPLGGTELTLDILLGLAFGGYAHINPEARAQGAKAWEEIGDFMKGITPSDKAALAALREAQHINADTLPGTPITAADLDVHVQRMRAAIDSLASDKPVNVETIVKDQQTDQQPTGPDLSELSDLPLQQIGDIGPGRELTRNTISDKDWDILERAGLVREGEAEDGTKYKYVPTDALWNEREIRSQAQAAARPRVTPEEKAAAMNRRADNYERAAKDIEDADVDVERAVALRAKAQEVRAQAEALLTNQPRYNPDMARIEQDTAIREAIQEHAKTVAAEEGIPQIPDRKTIAQTIEEQLVQAGRPPEEAKAGATLWQAFFDTTASRYGRTGQELFDRYMKGITGQPGQGPSLAQPEKLFQGAVPWYHSELERQIGTAKMGSASPKDWKNYIKGLSNKGVKADEVKWTGLEEWLDLQEGKVTKEQIQEYMKDGGVKVEEVILGENVPSADVIRQQIAQYEDGAPFETLNAERQNEIAQRADVRVHNSKQNTKFSQYVLPGGENYRELLLTLPHGAGGLGKPRDWDGIGKIMQKHEIPGDIAPDETELSMSKRILDEYGDRLSDAERAYLSDQTQRQGFHSSHFDQPNILSHIRFNERTDADGKRVLFIEEIQSDWAQEGRKRGFAGTVDTTGWTAKKPADGYARDWEVFNTEGQLMRSVAADNAEDAVRIAGEGGAFKSGVPRAPFVGKTEAWVGLSLKRMIRYAAENGFDRVAWANGEQSASRYDLSKHIDSIFVRPLDAVKYPGEKAVVLEMPDDVKMRLAVDQNGKVLDAAQPDFVGRSLDDIIGKDMAKKVMEAETATFEGVDLKVGGEGMKAFYDKIVPNVANDVLKKLGGGKVGKTGLELPGYAKSMPRLEEIDDVTWDAFQGAEAFEGGAKPMTSEVEMLVDGNKTRMTMVVDRNGVQFIDHDGELVVMFDAGDLIGHDRGAPTYKQWASDPSVATARLSKAWTDPQRWQNSQVIMGEASEIRPTSIEQAEQPGFDITPELRAKALETQALFQPAYHASPHTFDEFKLQHIGSGEGAQVYGWGLYFATNTKVRDWYYDNFMAKAKNEAKTFVVDDAQVKEIAAKGPGWMGEFIDEYMAYRKQGMAHDAAFDAVADDRGLNDNNEWAEADRATKEIDQFAVHEITAGDDPAYKTPTGEIVHTRLGGEAKAKADAIGQLMHQGYAGAAKTFDNLIIMAKQAADEANKSRQSYIKQYENELNNGKWEAHGDHGNYETSINGTRYKDEIAATPQRAIEQSRAALQKHIDNAKADMQKDVNRVTTLEKARSLLDEYVEPSKVLEDMGTTDMRLPENVTPDNKAGNTTVHHFMLDDNNAALLNVWFNKAEGKWVSYTTGAKGTLSERPGTPLQEPAPTDTPRQAAEKLAQNMVRLRPDIDKVEPQL